MKFIKVYFNGQLKSGAFIQDAFVYVNEDYTMTQLVTAIKEVGFISFMTGNMRKLVKI